MAFNYLLSALQGPCWMAEAAAAHYALDKSFGIIHLHKVIGTRGSGRLTLPAHEVQLRNLTRWGRAGFRIRYTDVE